MTTAATVTQATNANSTGNILIIDDDQSVLTMILFALTKYGYEITAASNAAQAYRLMQEQEFDAVLTDVMMPEEDGISLLATIHRQYPDLPVILMTGYAQLQMAVNAIKNGAFDFIHKPFDLDYLNKILTKAVEYVRLRRMEKNYHAELENMVDLRTNELKSAMALLEITQAELLKAVNSKSKFMSTVTHEMRTPMNGVVGVLDLLSEDSLSDSSRLEFVQLGKQAAENMMTLIDSMISFAIGSSRGDADQQAIIILEPTISALLNKYRNRFASKGIALAFTMAADVPRIVSCDGTQLKNLLEVLLDNALKFTKNGEVALLVSLERSEGNRAVLHFALRDTGIGIPDDMLEGIFESFTQVDGSHNRHFEGVGLGLSIARQIAEQFGGRIWAESDIGRGSCFHVIAAFDLPGSEA